MSSVDNRVVNMQFDNAKFEQGVKTTLASLEALNKGLKMEGATKGLNDIDDAAKRFSLQGIGQAVDSITSKFSALSIVGITALINIANQAFTTGRQMVSSLTVDPIHSGLQEYETNLNSIQTILSNTAWQHTGLKDVNAALNELNKYSDLTIYNFSEMARNIGTFTAAGVKLDTSVNAIKGIANLAAISGSSSEQASTAMYQLSQALATGTVKLMDWNSVVNAGMGGKVFQDALKETARVHGVAVDQIIKDEGSFRDSLSKGWLTSQILTETLAKFTGDLNAKQLRAMGYTDQQIKGIIALGKNATDAATKVKTFTQLINTLQESAGSGWAQTWQLIFGDFGEAKNLFTGAYNFLNKFISASANARNQVLSDWKALGGRTALIDGISNAFNALLSIIRPIKDAFREIFPAVTGKQLAEMSVAFRDFTEKLKIGADTAAKLKSTFAGVFAIFGIAGEIIKDAVKSLFELIGILTKGSGAILDTTASVGDSIVAFKKWLDAGDKIGKFFEGLVAILAKPIEKIKEFGQWISDAFNKIDIDATPSIENLRKAMTPLEAFGQRLKSIWEGLINVFKAVGEKLAPIGAAITDFVKGVIDKIKSSFGDIKYNDILDALNTGLIGGIVLLFHKMLKDGLKLDITGGFFEKINEAFESVTKTLKAMQLQLKAKALIEIAAAIAIMTAAAIALSLVDSQKLMAASAAMSVMFIDIFGSLALFDKITGVKGMAKLPLMTTGLILLAGAVVIMAGAVKTLSGMNWDELARGLTGLTGILLAMIGTVELMPQERMIATGLGLIAVAGAVKILASATKDFSTLNWEEIARGLVGVGVVLAAVFAVRKFAEADKGGLFQDLEFLVLAASIKVLALAVQDFAKLSWENVAKGLVAMAGAMAIMVTALSLIPPESVIGAAAILVASLSLGKIASALQQMGQMGWGEIGKALVAMLGALTLITVALDVIDPLAVISAAGVYIVALSMLKVADVLQQMGQMSWGEIGRAMTAFGGALLLIAIGVDAMTGAVSGAIAMVIVTAALAALAPILMLFGAMSWESIGKGLLALAGVFVVLGVAGIGMAPLVPILMGLGIAIGLLGVGMLAAGGGLLLFALGLKTMAESGQAGATAIVGIVTTLVGVIPKVMEEIALGIIAFAKVISTGGPAITQAMTVVLMSLIQAINTVAPAIISTLYNLLDKLLTVMQAHVPHMVDMGMRILQGFLNGIANNIQGVVNAATNVVVHFLNGVSNNLSRIIESGVQLILSFIRGLTNAMNQHSAELGKAGGDLALAIIRGMVNGLASGVGTVMDAARNVAQSALNAALSKLGIRSPSREFHKIGKFSSEGLALGLNDNADVVATAAENVGQIALDTMKKTLSNMSDAIGRDVNTTPVISPVLDLTNVRKDASQLDSLFSVKPIGAKATFLSANAAAVGYDNNQNASVTDNMESGNTSVTFVQNNTSPKALSTAEIYRNTNNQISRVKEVLPR